VITETPTGAAVFRIADKPAFGSDRKRVFRRFLLTF
jgi:hypothetical protein